MWLIAVHLVSSSFANAPLIIQVKDPSVTHVELKCKDETKRVKVTDGAAEFLRDPEKCTVFFRRKSGKIEGAGTWNCTLDECTLTDVHHAPIRNQDGRINVVLTHSVIGQRLELHCPGDYRERQPIEDNTSVFDNVPNDECSLLLKGGAPARFDAIRWGTYYCSVSGPILTCKPR
jgi:hypothetical protein